MQVDGRSLIVSLRRGSLRRGSTARRLIAIAIVLGIFAYRSFDEGGSAAVDNSVVQGSGQHALQEAFRQQLSGVWVQSSGTVERLLADDTEGDQHQRFIVRVAANQTILVSHNIDLAERAPVAAGDEIAFRGRYEWNARGGVVHWTHHDPQRGREDMSRGGWLRSNGTTVR